MTAVTPLIKLAFNWGRFPFKSIVPRIPVKFFYTVQGNNKETPIIFAILDSGCDIVTIPHEIAVSWGLELKDIPIRANTASGEAKIYSSKIDFSIGQVSNRTVKYENVDICVIEGGTEILMGIHPIFKDFDISIKASETRYVLEPRV
jgi:hypothetical protein